MAPSLVLQVIVGSWADSIRSRVRIMVIADVLSAALMAVIPLLWWRHALLFQWLALVVGVKAVVGVFQLACTSPVVVEVVPPDELITANGKINGTQSATDVIGKSLGGALIAAFTAPFAVLADALSYLASAALASRIKVVRSAPAAGCASSEAAESGPGEVKAPTAEHPMAERQRTRDVARNLSRRADLWCLMPVALANGITNTVIVIYCVRTLRIDSSLLAVLLSFGAVGGVSGGFLAGRIARRLGSYTLLLGIVATVLSLAPLLLVRQGLPAALAVVFLELAGAFGGTIILATVFGSIQSGAAAGSVARTMGIANNALQAAALLGIFIGGVIGELTSAHTALVCAVALLIVTGPPLCLLCIRAQRPAAP